MGRQGLSWTHLTVGRLPRKSPRKSPKRPRDPRLLSRRFEFLPPSRPAARSARRHPDQRLPRQERCPLRPWAPQGSPLPTRRERHGAPAGLSRNQPRGEREGGERVLGAIEATPGTRAGADQCPGHGRKDRMGASPTPSRIWDEVRRRGRAGEGQLAWPHSSPPPISRTRARLRALHPSPQAAGVAPSRPPLKPLARSGGAGRGPYLGVDFCVLRRRAAAQEAQKHQEQRQQSRPRRRLPAAENTARPARPSGSAPVAAHVLGA